MSNQKSVAELITFFLDKYHSGEFSKIDCNFTLHKKDDQIEKLQSALLEEKQKIRDPVKCLIETTIIDDVNWQKKNKDCLDLALHGIANNLYRTIKKFGDV